VKLFGFDKSNDNQDAQGDTGSFNDLPNQPLAGNDDVGDNKPGPAAAENGNSDSVANIAAIDQKPDEDNKEEAPNLTAS
jgi:hypothetical protein